MGGQVNFSRAIMIDFQGAQITSDVGFLLVREIDDRFEIIDHMKECLFVTPLTGRPTICSRSC